MTFACTVPSLSTLNQSFLLPPFLTLPFSLSLDPHLTLLPYPHFLPPCLRHQSYNYISPSFLPSSSLPPLIHTLPLKPSPTVEGRYLLSCGNVNTSNKDSRKGWISWYSDGCCTCSQQACHGTLKDRQRRNWRHFC